MQLRGRSPAEYAGMVAIGAVVVAAWVYSITLEYSFFAAVTPGSNPMFPYLGLAFTGIGLALWGIGFACAHKPFTQVMTMIMMLASGGTAVYIATVQFQAQGDIRYNIAADPTNYAKALTIVGVMLLLNVAMLVLKVIVWRFSQVGTGFFDRPQGYSVQQPRQPRYTFEQQARDFVEAEHARPKEERVLEQRDVRTLPPARRSPGLFARFLNGFNAVQQPAYAVVQEDEQNDELPPPATEAQKAELRRLDALPRVEDDGIFDDEDDETPVQSSESVDRKAESEHNAKPKK